MENEKESEGELDYEELDNNTESDITHVDLLDSDVKDEKYDEVKFKKVHDDENIQKFRSGQSRRYSADHAEYEFNKNRRIIIRNVPPVTYDEVKEFLGGYGISDISISKKQRHAIVTLLDGRKAEELVSQLRGQKLLGTPVDVALYHSENLLCITHLPFNLDENDFRCIVEEHGAVERCFLLKSLDGVRSKGYGFLEYVHNQEKSREVCRSLDGRRQGSCVVRCDFLHSSIVAFSQLHSLCLLINNLPPGFDDQDTLESIFSEVVAPIECKMVTHSGQTFGFAVVSYSTGDQAEQSQKCANGRMVNGYKIRVTFCIPGQTATQMFDKLVKEQASSGRIGLLPMPPIMVATNRPQPLMNPPIPAPLLVNPHQPAPRPVPHGTSYSSTSQSEVVTPLKSSSSVPPLTSTNLASPQVQNLLSQSPQVLGHFQQVLGQLQSQLEHQNTNQGKPSLLGPPPSMVSNPLQNVDLQVAILAVVLAIQLQQAQPSMLGNPLLQQMLISHLQQDSGPRTMGGAAKPSLLGNPMLAQANTMLQGLFSQSQTSEVQEEEASQGAFSASQFNLFTSLANQTFNPALLANLHVLLSAAHNSQESEQMGLMNGTSDKPGLLGDGPTSCRSGLSGNPPTINYSSSSQGNNIDSDGASSNPFFDLPNVGLANPLLALYLENQIKSELQQSQQPQPSNLSHGAVRDDKQPSLLGNHPSIGVNRPAGQWAGWQTNTNPPERKTLNFDDDYKQRQRQTVTKPGSNKRNYQQIASQDSYSNLGNSRQSWNQSEHGGDQSGGYQYNQQYNYSYGYGYDSYQQQQSLYTQGEESSYASTVSLADAGYSTQADDSSIQQSSMPTKKGGLLGRPVTKTQAAPAQTDYGDYGHQSSTSQQGTGQQDTGQQGSTYGNPQDWQEYQQMYCQYLADYKAYQENCMKQQQQQSYKQGSQHMPPPPAPPAAMVPIGRRSSSTSSVSSTTFNPVGASTPCPPNRGHLLPSPEASPEMGYIGQHSQGLGGHYADSYPKKKKVPTATLR